MFLVFREIGFPQAFLKLTSKKTLWRKKDKLQEKDLGRRKKLLLWNTQTSNCVELKHEWTTLG